MIPNHPALAVAMPSNALLWQAGLKVPEIHCHFVGETGKLDRVTLQGVMDAANVGLVTGVFGGTIPKAEIEAAHRNIDRQAKVYADHIWRKSGGDRDRIRQLIKAAVDRDALCLEQRLKVFQTQADLLRQGLHLSRNEAGEPLVVAQLPNNAEKYAHVNRTMIENHQQIIAGVLWLYQKADELLATKVELAAGRAAPQPDAAKQRANQAGPPKAVRTPGLDIDLSPIEKVQSATAAAIAELKKNCLLKASIECG